jgi:hypothetical protein
MNNIQGFGSNFIAQSLGGLASGSDAEIDKISKEFERMTLSQLLSFANTANDMSDSMFGGGAGERAFQPFLMDEYAKGFADLGGVGIAAAVKSEILKIQEAAQSQSITPNTGAI